MQHRAVHDHMTREPATLDVGARLGVASAAMDEVGVSALPVVDARGRPVGVLSRTDLLHAGVRARDGRRDTLLPTPSGAVGDVMGRELVTVAPSTSLLEAAQLMVDRCIHHLYVESERRLVGVLSTTDLMRAVGTSRIAIPLGSLMNKPAVCVPIDTPLAVALAELESHGVSGLVVTERDEAVGLFTREAALAAGTLTDDASVEDAMSLRYILEVTSTAVHRAAARAVALDVKHILVRDAQHRADGRCVPGVVGVVTGLDIAGAVLLSR